MRTKPRIFYKRMFLRMYQNPFAMSIFSIKRKIVFKKLYELHKQELALNFLLKEIENFRKSNLSEIPNS